MDMYDTDTESEQDSWSETETSEGSIGQHFPSDTQVKELPVAIAHCSKWVNEKPSKASANIAMYNPHATGATELQDASRAYAVLSRHARKPSASSPPLDEISCRQICEFLYPKCGTVEAARDCALLECRLAIRNTGCLYPKAAAIPFKMAAREWSRIDVDGDLLVTCGESDYTNASESVECFVGYGRVCKETTDFYDDVSDGILKYPIRQRAGRGVWYSNVLADGKNGLIWTSSSHGLLHGFGNGELRASLQLSRECRNPLWRRYALAMVDPDSLCCAGGGRKMCIWNVESVLKEFRTRSEAATEVVSLLEREGRDAAEARDICLQAPSTKDLNNFVQMARQERARRDEIGKRRRLRGKQPPPKAYKSTRQRDEESHSIDEDVESGSGSDSDRGSCQTGQFVLPSCGLPASSTLEVLPKAGRNAIKELRTLSSSRILVTEVDARTETPLKAHLFDAGAQRMTGFLRGRVDSIERQLCADINLVFTTESRRSCQVWDLRLCSAIATLPNVSAHPSNVWDDLSFLGVPWASGMGGALAFTSGADECVRAWDLRSLRKEALWTLSTGNLVGVQLAWHESTQSLFVATRNLHQRTFGRYFGTYRYGERVSDSEGGSMDEDGDSDRASTKKPWWPPKAANGRGFFPQPFNCSQPYLLRYAFGGPSHGIFKKWAEREAAEKRARMHQRMQEFNANFRPRIWGCSENS